MILFPQKDREFFLFQERKKDGQTDSKGERRTHIRKRDPTCDFLRMRERFLGQWIVKRKPLSAVT